ncbi:hypothetical protein PR048_011431 [Dryococelus australis]|uniref:PiggyBac transposable element-derived protein domain-containing protein n=1 Tax=Dryococelus australis TaxID=614101 RepID=A0ABQ9HM22_9NEOP|nr:hypothetical protein PR048_011431 [Dryococelus australis]
MDNNWFTSFDLAKHLLTKNITIVGTVRKNKLEIPTEFLTNKQRTDCSSMFGFQEDCSLMYYAPTKNKNVLLISTMHHDTAIDNRTGNLNKPEIVTFYNSTKGGVAVVDKLCVTYNTSRNSRRWPITIFYSLLNIAGINANIIHIGNNNCEQKRRLFLRELVIGLVDEHLHSRAHITNVPKTLKERVQKISGHKSSKENQEKVT